MTAEIEQIAVHELRPEDILVVRYARRLSYQESDAVRRGFRRTLTERGIQNLVIVLDEGATLDVLRETPAADSEETSA